jgi:hypothetical protein
MLIAANNLHALSNFAAVANEYCKFVDSWHDGRPAKLYSKLEELLARLHVAILPVEQETPDRKRRKFEKLEMTRNQYYAITKVIGATVGQEAVPLFEMHLGTRPEADEVQKWLASRAEMLDDDLTDIYRDLHNGLEFWEVNTLDGQIEAAWQWRFQYEAHWGKHLFNAMTTIHEARYRLYAD